MFTLPYGRSTDMSEPATQLFEVTLQFAAPPDWCEGEPPPPHIVQIKVEMWAPNDHAITTALLKKYLTWHGECKQIGHTLSHLVVYKSEHAGV